MKNYKSRLDQSQMELQNEEDQIRYDQNSIEQIMKFIKGPQNLQIKSAGRKIRAQTHEAFPQSMPASNQSFNLDQQLYKNLGGHQRIKSNDLNSQSYLNTSQYNRAQANFQQKEFSNQLLNIQNIDLKLIQILAGHQNSVNCLEWSNTQQRLFSGGSDYCIKNWKTPQKLLRQKTVQAEFTINCKFQKVLSMCYHQEGLLLTGHQDGMIRGWDVKMAAPKHSVRNKWDYDEDLGYRCKLSIKKAHTGVVNQILPYMQESQFISAGGDGLILIYNMQGDVIETFAQTHYESGVKSLLIHDQCTILSGQKGLIRL